MIWLLLIESLNSFKRHFMQRNIGCSHFMSLRWFKTIDRGELICNFSLHFRKPLKGLSVCFLARLNCEHCWLLLSSCTCWCSTTHNWHYFTTFEDFILLWNLLWLFCFFWRLEVFICLYCLIQILIVDCPKHVISLNYNVFCFVASSSHYLVN